jgi:hypothetical protein
MLGVEQPSVHRHFKCAAGRRDKLDLLDPRLKRLQQFRCQTGSELGIVSNCAILDGDVH